MRQFTRISLAIKLNLGDRLLGLVEAVSLGTEARGSRAGLLEVSAEGRGQERSEDELSTPIQFLSVLEANPPNSGAARPAWQLTGRQGERARGGR